MQQKSSVASKELEATFKDDLLSLNNSMKKLDQTLTNLMTAKSEPPAPTPIIPPAPKKSLFDKLDESVNKFLGLE